jgi:hypothetical protein
LVGDEVIEIAGGARAGSEEEDQCFAETGGTFRLDLRTMTWSLA